ncbi:hypothetical protein HMPREF9551_02690 [Escherichia coli MS 196-1]|nr:hypothetical protein HMPREF9551_02690 [Escherichia coli MS 196-1]
MGNCASQIMPTAPACLRRSVYAKLRACFFASGTCSWPNTPFISRTPF